MACLLTQGFQLDCKDSVGGIKAIYVANMESVTSYTETAGEITGITMETGSFFYKYAFRKQTGNYTETIESSDANGTVFYSQEVNIQLTKPEVAKRNEILLLAKADVLVIVEDRNGNFTLFGKNNGVQVGGTHESGTAMGDMSGYNLTFSGAEETPAAFVDGSIIATITQ